MKKICFLHFDSCKDDLYLPTMWFNFKRYYEVNSKYSDQWEWIPPKIELKNVTIDEIAEELINHNADVYAFSSYMWSWNSIKIVAQRVRKDLPNAVIVLGGPHQGTTYTSPIIWFKKYDYFDATCLPTEYGEFFILDMLDLITEDRLDWNNVRNSYHRKGQGPIGDKRSFVFPKGLLSEHLEIGLEYSRIGLESGRVIKIPYETTRGCPYGCVYCEWGGGINSKVVAKSIEDIEEDLMYFPVLNIDTLYLSDANFGILPRDERVAELFASLSGTCLKKIYVVGLAKTTVEKRKKVLEPLLRSKLMNGYTLAIQTINPEVEKIIDRVDISVEENLKLAEYLISKYNNCQNQVELINGLPGYTLKDFYDECSLFYGKYAKSVGPWYVLPDSPGANPEYLKKWDIKLVPYGFESESEDTGYSSIYDKRIVQEPTMFLPVSTFSYSTEDWKEFMFYQDMETIFYNRYILKPFIDFMLQYRNQPAGVTLKKIFNILSKISNFYDPINNYLQQIVDGKMANSDWKDMPNLNMHVLKGYYYLWVNNLDEIFQSLHESFNDDEQVTDCLEYIKQTTIRENYSTSWTSKWDWKTWEEGGVLKKHPINVYTIAKPIEWSPTIDRMAHTVVDGKKFNLQLYAAQQPYQKQF
jgi:putative methyltransferase